MNSNLLKSEFIKNGLTHAEVAKAIGISESTLTRKLKKGTFGLDEADKLIKLLKIANPSEIFFA